MKESGCGGNGELFKLIRAIFVALFMSATTSGRKKKKKEVVCIYRGKNGGGEK